MCVIIYVCKFDGIIFLIFFFKQGYLFSCERMALILFTEQGSHLSGDTKFHVFAGYFQVKAMNIQVILASNHFVLIIYSCKGFFFF